MITQALYKELHRITDEERALLSGDKSIQKLYRGHIYVLPIQNLVENLIWSIWNKQPNKRSINQVTMGLLFLQLLNHMDRMEAGEDNSKTISDVTKEI